MTNDGSTLVVSLWPPPNGSFDASAFRPIVASEYLSVCIEAALKQRTDLRLPRTRGSASSHEERLNRLFIRLQETKLHLKHFEVLAACNVCDELIERLAQSSNISIGTQLSASELDRLFAHRIEVGRSEPETVRQGKPSKLHVTTQDEVPQSAPYKSIGDWLFEFARARAMQGQLPADQITYASELARTRRALLADASTLPEVRSPESQQVAPALVLLVCGLATRTQDGYCAGLGVDAETGEGSPEWAMNAYLSGLIAHHTSSGKLALALEAALKQEFSRRERSIWLEPFQWLIDARERSTKHEERATVALVHSTRMARWLSVAALALVILGGWQLHRAQTAEAKELGIRAKISSQAETLSRALAKTQADLRKAKLDAETRLKTVGEVNAQLEAQRAEQAVDQGTKQQQRLKLDAMQAKLSEAKNAAARADQTLLQTQQRADQLGVQLNLANTTVANLNSASQAAASANSQLATCQNSLTLALTQVNQQTADLNAATASRTATLSSARETLSYVRSYCSALSHASAPVAGTPNAGSSNSPRMAAIVCQQETVLGAPDVGCLCHESRECGGFDAAYPGC